MNQIDKTISKYTKTEKERNEPFNAFQTAFYTDINVFGNYTNFECNQFAFLLLQNMGKGRPALSNLMFKVKGFNFDYSSIEVLKALQRKFVNKFKPNRSLPDFIFFKTIKNEKVKQTRVTEKGLVFANDVVIEICRRMIIDSKTYEYLQFTNEIQKMGKQLSGDFMVKNTNTKSKSKKSK